MRIGLPSAAARREVGISGLPVATSCLAGIRLVVPNASSSTHVISVPLFSPVARDFDLIRMSSKKLSIDGLPHRDPGRVARGVSSFASQLSPCSQSDQPQSPEGLTLDSTRSPASELGRECCKAMRVPTPRTVVGQAHRTKLARFLRRFSRPWYHEPLPYSCACFCSDASLDKYI